MEKILDYFSALPGWMAAMLVFAAGWLAAGVARVVLARLLRLMRFDRLCERTGVIKFLKRGEVPYSPCELVGRGFYWAILIGIFLETARLFNISIAMELRQRFMSALPAFLSAVFVLSVGLLLVGLLAGFVRTFFRNAGNLYANFWARMTRWVGVLLVIAVAFEQMEIRGSILAAVIQIVIAAFALGMALAFGLGCKDMARNAMEKLINDLKERHKDTTKPDLEG